MRVCKSQCFEEYLLPFDIANRRLPTSSDEKQSSAIFVKNINMHMASSYARIRAIELHLFAIQHNHQYNVAQ